MAAKPAAKVAHRKRHRAFHITLVHVLWCRGAIKGHRPVQREYVAGNDRPGALFLVVAFPEAKRGARPLPSLWSQLAFSKSHHNINT